MELAKAPEWLYALLRQEEPPAPPPRPSGPPGDDQDGPAAHFNASTTWHQLLTRDGWTLAKTLGSGEQRWTRPGKSPRQGISATVGHNGEDCLKVFTSSVPELTADAAYSRFGYEAAMHHGGDRSALAREIRRTMNHLDRPDRDDWSAFVPTTTEAAPNGNGHATGVLAADGVSPERVDWLWEGRLPVGKLVTLDGDPDLGKSTLSLDLAARLSRGAPMPDGQRLVGPSAVLLMSAEDGLADTIRPRLDAAGADPAKVHVWVEVHDVGPDAKPRRRPPSLPEDIGRLEEHVRRLGIRLVIIDVLAAYLAPTVNAHHDQDVRRVLHRLMVMAERTRCTVLVLRHLNKSGGGKAIYRGGGSIGIVGAARVGLMVGVDPEDDTRNVLAVVKCNLAVKPRALAYRIDPAPLHGCGVIRWLGHSHHTADALALGPQPEPEDGQPRPRDAAAGFLIDLLTEGPRSVQDVKSEAQAAGIAWRTVRRAQEELGVAPRKVGKPGDREQWWEWGLPTPEDVHSAEDGLRVTRRTSSDPVDIFDEDDGTDSGPGDLQL
jgi:hypothetical protein